MYVVLHQFVTPNQGPSKAGKKPAMAGVIGINLYTIKSAFVRGVTREGAPFRGPLYAVTPEHSRLAD